MGTKKMGAFLVWTPKNGGHSVCKTKYNFKAKFAYFLLNGHKIVKFLKMRAKRAKNFQFSCKI